MGATHEPRGEEAPTCPICRSRHVARAVVLRGDYRCPDCSALLDGDGRITADPRPWVEPRVTTNDRTRPEQLYVGRTNEPSTEHAEGSEGT